MERRAVGRWKMQGHARTKENSEQVSEKDSLTRETDPYGWVERSVWTEPMLKCLRKGGPEGGVWYSLHDKVFQEKTLRAAYAQVALNKGAPGVDGKTVKDFGEHLEEEIQRIITSWKAKELRSQAVRRSWITKTGGKEKRPLGIPTVRDRVIQRALVMVLEPIFEATFSEHSHGYRPGRKAQDALEAVRKHLQEGKEWVVDADLQGYFDSIPHEALLTKVRRKVADRRIIELIGEYLKAGVMEGLELREPETGTPQGGVISPLLANIYLNELDLEMEQAGIAMERYADDFVIFCKEQGQAEDAKEKAQAWTEAAGLKMHPSKTRLVHMGEEGAYMDFLGFRLLRHTKKKTGKKLLLRLVKPKSLKKIKEAIRENTPRRMGHSLKTVTIPKLNRVLRGWFGYFRSVHASLHQELDGFVRRRLRSQLSKAEGRRSWGGGKAHQIWPNTFFAEAGLFSLKEAHDGYLQSH